MMQLETRPAADESLQLQPVVLRPVRLARLPRVNRHAIPDPVSGPAERTGT